MALLMLEHRPVDKAAAPPAWCEEHNARLRVVRVEPAVVEYECPPGGEHYTDRIEQIHVVEQRWMREEVRAMDQPNEPSAPSGGESPTAPAPSPSTTPTPAGGSQSPTSDGKPLPGKPETK